MTTGTTKIAATAAVITDSLALVSTVLPEVGVFVEGLKLIWLKSNPGKTEADWIGSLAGDSGELTTEADQILIDAGYVRQGDGSWKHAVTGEAPPAK